MRRRPVSDAKSMVADFEVSIVGGFQMSTEELEHDTRKHQAANNATIPKPPGISGIAITKVRTDAATHNRRRRV
jgi:hypothetical protein